MANGRNLKSGRSQRRVDVNRDGEGFIALPIVVFNSKAYRGLSHPAKNLLMELAAQLDTKNNRNGQLLASTRFLGERGWTSHDVVTRALKELVAAGLAYQTVKGCRPNKASWWAVTWYALAPSDKYDAGAAVGFVRGAYRDPPMAPKNAGLSPSHGIERRVIVPSNGIEAVSVVPSHGTISGSFDHLSIPPDGDHLEEAICCGDLDPAIDQRERQVRGGSGIGIPARLHRWPPVRYAEVVWV